MSYARSTLWVVSGLAVTYVASSLGTAVYELEGFIVVGMLVCLGLFVAVYGFFSGIEAAIAAAIEGTTDDRSARSSE